MFSTTQSRNKKAKERILAAFFAVIILGTLMCYPVAYSNSEASVTITVSDKERVTHSNGNGGVTSKYLIYTKQGEVFENTDTLLFGKWNSSDLYGKLEKGHTYTVSVAGWRIPLMSHYRNIVAVGRDLTPVPAVTVDVKTR